MADSAAMAAAQRMLRVQRRQLDRLELAQRRRIHAILERARTALLADLAGAPQDRFTAQTYRVALARVQAGIGQLEREMFGGLVAGAGEAYDAANEHLVRQIATFSARFEGTVRPTSWQPLSALSDEVLLDRYQASVRVYGSGLIRQMQDSMAVSIARESSWTDAVRELAGRNSSLAQDYYGMDSAQSHRQSRAERIVRTEYSHAYNRAHHEDLRRANEADPGYQKTLVSTFDGRQGKDSVSVHGQIREIDKPFEDNQGRVYMHPPNRPNDREVEVPTRPEWRARGFGVRQAVE